MRIVATIVPIVVIVAITVWGLLVAGGIMHYRQEHSEEDTESITPLPEFSEKWPEELEEPKLYEVSLKVVGMQDHHDALHVRPLAVLLADPGD